MSDNSMFIRAHDDRRRMPVVMISGFLGSGKTTLINAILRDPRFADTAVAVNEFGEIGLDQHLIENDSGSTVVMANGCLCCNIGDDLEVAVLRLFSHRDHGAVPSFRRLIIETSGMADPAPIAQAIMRNPILSRLLRLDALITVVDARFGLAQLSRHPEVQAQTAIADQLVISKADLTAASDMIALRAALRRQNPIASLHPAQDGHCPTLELPPAFVEPGLAGTTTAAILAESQVSDRHAAHGAPATAICLTSETPLRWRAFENWLRQIRLGHAHEVLRIKALLNVAEAKGPVILHGIHHVLHPPVALDRWPDTDRRSRIVFITQGLPADVIAASWRTGLAAMSEPKVA